MTSITVRDVPNEARDELAGRAARAGQSLQEYLRIELIELARRPTVSDLLADIRRRKAATGTTMSIEEIVALRDADRR